MFIVIYRWRVKPEMESRFVESWSEITEFYLRNFEGALGSRLHLGKDGIWYAYAQWQSIEHRRRAFENTPKMPIGDAMRESIEESFPELQLEMISDFLVLPEKT